MDLKRLRGSLLRNAITQSLGFSRLIAIASVQKGSASLNLSGFKEKCFQDEYLVIAAAGAYGFNMANTYYLQEMPTEICL